MPYRQYKMQSLLIGQLGKPFDDLRDPDSQMPVPLSLRQWPGWGIEEIVERARTVVQQNMPWLQTPRARYQPDISPGDVLIDRTLTAAIPAMTTGRLTIQDLLRIMQSRPESRAALENRGCERQDILEIGFPTVYGPEHVRKTLIALLEKGFPLAHQFLTSRIRRYVMSAFEEVLDLEEITRGET